MAYTASALSFLLEGLEVPVVLTGAQRPLGSATDEGQDDAPTDAVHNVTSALRFCEALAERQGSQRMVTQVFLAFDGLLLRGNCARKVDSRQLRAFNSPNLPPVGQLLEGRISLESSLLYRREQPASSLTVSLDKRFAELECCPNWNKPAVASCFLLPGVAARQLESCIWPGLQRVAPLQLRHG